MNGCRKRRIRARENVGGLLPGQLCPAVKNEEDPDQSCSGQ